MSIITVRRAKADDAEALAECIDAAYSIYANRIENLPAVSEGVGEAIKNHRVWVAERHHQIVGGLVLVAHEDYMVVENIAVRPESSGSGLGRTLIARAEQDCRELGLRELRLSTHKDMPENVAIYTRLGWKETGRSGNKVHMSKTV